MSAFPQIDPETLRRQLAIAIPPAQASMASPSAPANAPAEQAPPTVQMASPNTPSLPAPSLPSVKAPRGTSAGDQSELSRLESTGSGISQIKSPWARIPLQVMDSVAGSLSPIARSIEQGIPGTQEHHNLLVRQSQGQVGQDVANEEKQAQTREASARTAALENPPDEVTPLATDQGYVGLSKKTGQANPIMVNGEQAQPIEKQQPQNIHVLPSGEVVSISRDPKTGKSTAEVVYQGDPAVKTEVKQLEKAGKPHQVLINSATGEEIKDLGETGEKPPVINVNAGNAGLDRETKQFGAPYQKGFEAANGQLEKIDKTMRSVDAGYVGQGLAIPELLTSLVSGAGTGVRITQPELNAITAHRGIKGDAESWFGAMAGKGNLTATDKAQIKAVLGDAQRVIREKQSIHQNALDSIESASSRDQAIAADKQARQNLVDYEKFGHYVGQTVQLKNGQTVIIKRVHPDGSFD